MKLSRRNWQVISLLLFLVAITWGACGLSFFAIPIEPTETLPDPEGIGFEISRSCFLGPAFALGSLAYLALRVGRRKEHAARWSELVAALGVTLGLVPAIAGLAGIIEPTSSGDPMTETAMCSLFCLLPGLSMMGLSGLFWYWSRGRDGL
jgi:hypothetical protein